MTQVEVEVEEEAETDFDAVIELDADNEGFDADDTLYPDSNLFDIDNNNFRLNKKSIGLDFNVLGQSSEEVTDSDHFKLNKENFMENILSENFLIRLFFLTFSITF